MASLHFFQSIVNIRAMAHRHSYLHVCMRECISMYNCMGENIYIFISVDGGGITMLQAHVIETQK